MSKLRRSRLVRCVALTMVLTWLPGCMATRTFDPSASTFADEVPRNGEIFLRDGSSRPAIEIFVVGDSLFAYEPDEAGAGVDPQIRVARSEVLGVQERYQKEPESTLLIGGLVVGLGLGAYWLGRQMPDFSFD